MTYKINIIINIIVIISATGRPLLNKASLLLKNDEILGFSKCNIFKELIQE